YDVWVRRLKEELGVEPAPETAAMAEAIRERKEPRGAKREATAPDVPGPGAGRPAVTSARADSGSAAPVTMSDAAVGSSGRAAALTAAVALGGAAFFAARVMQTGGEGAAQPAGVSLLAYLVSWLIIVVGLWFLFERAEETVSPAGRARVSAWLRVREGPAGAEAGGIDAARWAEGFVGAFDRIFGPKHLSLHCFLRSTAASVVAVTVLLLLWIAIRPEQFSAFASTQGMRGLGEVILITFIVNVVADYLSLLETRVALTRLERWRSVWARAGVLVADALATFVVWLVFYAGLPFLLIADVSSIANDVMLFLQFQVWSYAPTIHEVMSLSAEGGGPPVGIWFYSTFLTSIWLWLYLGAGLLARAADATGTATARGFASLAGWFDADRQPFRVLGLAAMVIVTAAYGFGWLLNAL
ncbi:MAG: hypothetical protein R3266_13660, partial [Gemmatimonadota bacterium]|nr:hypothetical protein [Gemmatimonadota bacterium]